MKGLGLIAASLLLLLAALLAFAPATLADWRLAASTDGRLRLAAATGTLWRGEGTLTDAGNSWQLPLAWSVSPAALLRGELNVALAPVGAATQPAGSIALRSTGVSLANVRAALPAQALVGMLPVRPAPALGGDIGIDASTFAWNGGGGEGSLNAQWLRARLATAAGVADLGTVEMVVTPQDRRLLARVTNSGGEVRVNGTIAFTSSGSEGDITVAPLPGAPPALARALAGMARPDANGAVRLSWRNNARSGQDGAPRGQP